MKVQLRKAAGRTRAAEPSPLDRSALVLLFVFLLSDITGGAARYFSAIHGLPWLPYIPNMLVAAALGLLFFAYLAQEGVTSTYLGVFILLWISALYGLFNLRNPSQVEFGLWSIVPFLFGIVAVPAFVRWWRRLVPYAAFLWAVAVLGVFINFFYTWPWIGSEYQFGGHTFTASRLWVINQLGLARLPGFSEASFFVAPQILFLAIFLRESIPKKWRRWMWIASGLAIALTTSKTPLVVYLILSLPWTGPHRAIRRPWRLIPALATFLDVALPFCMLTIKIDWLASFRSKVAVGLLASFVDRLQTGWPVWIRMIVAHGNVLLGRGLGGIGTAQEHFEPWLFSPSDNAAVYIYATFGVLGLAVFLFYGRKASRSPAEGPVGRFFFFTACFVSLAGMTISVVDTSLLGLALGASLRYFQEEKVATWSPGASRHLPAAARTGAVTRRRMSKIPSEPQLGQT